MVDTIDPLDEALARAACAANGVDPNTRTVTGRLWWQLYFDMARAFRAMCNVLASHSVPVPAPADDEPAHLGFVK